MTAAPMTSRAAVVAPLLLAAVLAGCGAEQEELQGWMEQQRRAAQPNVAPIAAPRPFEPVPYAGARSGDPFGGQKLTGATHFEVREPNPMVTAEMARRKEPLEAMPLDTMTMVGSMRRQGRLVALVRADNLLYQVQPGNHLGQNYGRVISISETEVKLRELAQDSAGEWTPRTTTLQLQEPAR